jgi:hypothetical protein
MVCARKFLLKRHECASATRPKALEENVYLVDSDRKLAQSPLSLETFQSLDDDSLTKLPLSNLQSIQVVTPCGDLYYEREVSLVDKPSDITPVEGEPDLDTSGSYRIGLVSHQKQALWLEKWLLKTNREAEKAEMQWIAGQCLDVFKILRHG